MRRILSLFFALVLGLTVTTTLAADASAATPYCGITWGSQPRGSQPVRLASAPITAARSGRHTCYDRFVIDLAGSRGGYSVRYVTTVRAPGSGNPVTVRGAARLKIVLGNPAHNASGRPTFKPANPREVVNVSGYRTFRQVALAGSFEGQTTLALGVRSRLPYRVFTLNGPGGARLVIDVAHRW